MTEQTVNTMRTFENPHKVDQEKRRGDRLAFSGVNARAAAFLKRTENEPGLKPEAPGSWSSEEDDASSYAKNGPSSAGAFP